jgi:hypothetical protein
MRLEAYSEAQLLAWLSELEGQYRGFEAGGLDLDLTRGKPSIAQLELSAALDGTVFPRRGSWRPSGWGSGKRKCWSAATAA